MQQNLEDSYIQADSKDSIRWLLSRSRWYRIEAGKRRVSFIYDKIPDEEGAFSWELTNAAIKRAYFRKSGHKLVLNRLAQLQFTACSKASVTNLLSNLRAPW